MARKRRLTPEKENIIQSLIETYDLKTAADIQEALKDLMGGILEVMLEAELTEDLGYEKNERETEEKENYRNGYKPKKIRSSAGELEKQVPQDRRSEFEPKIVPKYKKDISEMEQKIINMYARGLTTREISEQIEDIYGFEASAELVSRITDKIVPEIENWQNRPLAEVYPIVLIDAIYFSVRKDKTVQKTAVYIVMGVDAGGMKDVLAIEIGETESSKFWLSVLNSLKNRGVKDILVLCADGLSGIKEAIEASFPKTEYQWCIVHMVRNTLKHVSEKDRKAFANDLKTIYHAPDEQAGQAGLASVTEKWDIRYPGAMRRWSDQWDVICPIFKYSMAVRKALYEAE